MRSVRKNWFRGLIFFALIILILYSSFAVGYVAGQKGRPVLGLKKSPVSVVNTEVGKTTSIDFSIYWDAWAKLQQKSVNSPDPQKMLYGSISGMLSSLNDPYTVFFSPEDNQRFRQDIGGEFDGIGIEIVLKNGYPTVVAPLSKTPAEAAGLKAGDVILEVDGTKTNEIGFNEVIDRIRGEKGTKVKLKLSREGKDEPLEIEVVRDTIIVKSVEWKIEKNDGRNIAFVNIRQFGDDTDALFGEFAKEVVKEKPDGIIVDLRNNPGGYLETSVNLSSYFIDGGTVVSEKDKDGNSKEYKVTKKATLRNFKTAVLINGGSASASEIFSGALQDRKAGKLIGEKTFGKGSVQEIVELSDGSAVKITVAKWFTPNGRTINGEGIVPDIVLKNDDADPKNDLQLNRAYEYLKTGK